MYKNEIAVHAHETQHVTGMEHKLRKMSANWLEVKNHWSHPDQD